MLFPDPEQFSFAAGAAGAGTDTAGDAVGVGVTDVGAVVETAVAGVAGAAEVVDADGEGVAGAAAVVDADGDGSPGASSTIGGASFGDGATPVEAGATNDGSVVDDPRGRADAVDGEAARVAIRSSAGSLVRSARTRPSTVPPPRVCCAD